MVSASKNWVWDASVRLGHWLLAACFATAYATGESESWRFIHAISGGGVFGIVAFRFVWGFVGTPFARFGSFVHHPRRAIAYLVSLFSGAPEHHTGHNPAGGWAVVGLLGLSAASAVTGWVIYQGSAARWLEKSHEFLANLTLLLVLFHVFAVVVSAKLHRENLVKAMVLGYKPSRQGQTLRPAFLIKMQLTGLTLLLFFAVLGAWLAAR